MTETRVRPELSLKHPDRFFRNGEWVSPSTSTVIDVLDCATDQPIRAFAAATAYDVSLAVGAAREAFDRGPWPRISPRERAVFLRAIAEGIDERSEELSALWSMQSGVLHTITSSFNGFCAGIFSTHADLADSFEWEERHTPTMGGAAGYLVREPVGVVGAIVPWNGPLALIVHKVAPALLAGCTVVLKA